MEAISSAKRELLLNARRPRHRDVYTTGQWHYVYVLQCKRQCDVSGGQWTHVAMTYDSTSKKGCIYINGVLDAYATYTGSGAGTLYTGYNSTFRLGQNDWGPTGSEFDGKIDSLRISNVARVFTPFIPQSAAHPAGQPGAHRRFRVGLDGLATERLWRHDLCWETTSSRPPVKDACTRSARDQ